jgi:hypothetical protein
MGQAKTQKRGRRQEPSRLLSRGWLSVLLAVVLLTGGGLLIGLLTRTNRIGPVPKAYGIPRMEIAQERVDYGDVKVNTPIETIFHIRNVGDQPLQILGEPQVEVVRGC